MSGNSAKYDGYVIASLMTNKSGKKKEAKDAVSIPADVRHYIDIVRAESNEDLKRYTGALMEDNRDQIKGISEQFVDFRRTLDLHTEMLKSHEKWLGNIDQKLGAHDLRFENIDHTLNSHTEMIGALAEDVAVLKEDMSIVKKDISEIKGDMKQKVDHGEFVALEHRVAVVEVNA